jgi:riboflavin synthase
MFTGIIQCVGVIISSEITEAGRRLVVDPCGWTHRAFDGDSIAVNGVCLTVAEGSTKVRLVFDVITETLRRSSLGDLAVGDRVNLEHAARADSMLDGHVVQGHVDAVGVVRSIKDNPEDWLLRIEAGEETLLCAAPKGSIAIEGVSLTIAGVGDDWLEVALIPTTLERTTLGDLEAGKRVNLETDIIARQVVHALRRSGRI